MDVLNPECAAQSVGPANQLFGLLIQTILAAQCAISPKDMWPKDYGPTAIEQGMLFLQYFLLLIIVHSLVLTEPKKKQIVESVCQK